MNIRSQAWSLDLILGVIIFLSLSVLFLTILFSSGEETALRNDADRIYSQFDSESTPSTNYGVFRGNSVSQEGLEALYNASYDEVRAELDISGDFCIVVVNEDTGGIKSIEGQEGNKSSFGDDRVEVSEGINCGEDLEE